VSAPDLAVVLAGAGEGTRLGDRGPKLLLEIAGATPLERVGRVFLAHPAVGEIVLAAPDRLVEAARKRLAALSNPRRVPVTVIPGGATRRESVAASLRALQTRLPLVAVHDVARLLVSADLVTRVLEAARASGAAIPALPIKDTVKEVEGARVLRTLPRGRLQVAQTPQIFARDILARAHDAGASGAEPTDDASMVEAIGVPVSVVPGDPANLKLTEPTDLIVVERLVEDLRESR
jgi:2-C-methyl-D-erythritol 4-phosphate cytidylyltransferase